MRKRAQDLLGGRLVAVGRDGDAVDAHEGLGEANDLGLQRAKEAAGVADGRRGRRAHRDGSSEVTAQRLGEREAVVPREGQEGVEARVGMDGVG